MTVTATLDDTGVGWPDTAGRTGWTERRLDDSHLSGDIRRRGVHPGGTRWIPTVTQATCTAGEVTVPTIVSGDRPDQASPTLLDPPGPYDPGTDDYTVTVTATLADGQAWGTMPPTWTYVDPTTATFTVS